MELEKLIAEYHGKAEAYQHAVNTINLLYLGNDLSWGVVESCLQDTLRGIIKARDGDEVERKSPRWYKLETMRKTYVAILAQWQRMMPNPHTLTGERQ